MGGKLAVEKRLTALEKDVAKLKKALFHGTKPNWLRDIAGSFKDDPEFDEILRLGREIRRADRSA